MDRLKYDMEALNVTERINVEEYYAKKKMLDSQRVLMNMLGSE